MLRALNKRRKFKKGQSLTEFTFLTVIIIGSFLAMQIYVKRGIQGRMKSAIDDLGDQYDPQRANTALVQRISSNTETTIVVINDLDGIWTKRTDEIRTVERKEGFVGTGAFDTLNNTLNNSGP
tara:strand:+ start:99 stop:467 length:369 start_codon:yes stop_codon:yes gene_type:complete